MKLAMPKGEEDMVDPVVYQKNDLRITLLTSRLLRVEKGTFTDLPTQTVWNRDLGTVEYWTEETRRCLTIKTVDTQFEVDLRKGKILSVTLKNGVEVRDFRYGNLLGTARTLDTANGAVKLSHGIMSRIGVAVMDDSKSLLLTPEGEILPRMNCTDQYYFAYGHDYRAALRDFFRLTGPVPLIPKFALGNWWSRYRAYTQAEYQALMQKFIDKNIPITVATIDMDWHWTDVIRRFGAQARPDRPRCREEVLYNTALPGWTGYSWNTELFPDHRGLLDWLHQNGFKVTMNVHPSQGIRFFEDGYPAMCRRLGRDPETRECIRFDIGDPAFREAYFEELHHPLEEEGVDFWWLDWQQGTQTRIPGLDPLWALNHYHSLDMQQRGKRPMILSRYAGLGSHRYPLGFSGDTIVTWKSLQFQPYFTNTAANAGYTWWSHDIGGHMRGVQDDELYLRWLQYGVFSPINRLHSSNSDYMGKEPWKRSRAVERIAEDFLRLRHKLIPFLYSANYQTHLHGTPICEPMYYRYDREDAYKAKNQYIFGGSLLVCPITRKADKRLNLAYADVWLPEGIWTDLFTGQAYRGGRWVRMYRDLDSIPVLAPAGAIVPMYSRGDSNDLSAEQPLDIHIWRGSGSFELYEDDGETMDYAEGKRVVTTFHLEEDLDVLRLTITPPRNSFGILPKTRQLRLIFRDVEIEDIPVTLDNKPVIIELQQFQPRKPESREELRAALLTRVQAGNDWKSIHFRKKIPTFVADALKELDAMIR